MKKIELEIFRLGTVVYGSIIGQEGIPRGCGTLLDHEGYSIRSNGAPALEERALYIRGTSEERDERAFYRNFNRVEDAAKYKYKVEKLVEKFNTENA